MLVLLIIGHWGTLLAFTVPVLLFTIDMSADVLVQRRVPFSK